MTAIRLRRGAAIVTIALLAGALLAGCMPQPSGAPEAGRYLVYFDEFSANLTSDARKVVADAAEKAKQIGAVTVRVEARASATGSAVANQKLAETRAQVTYDELRKDGVSPTIITQTPIGQTGSGDPGITERRVDIVLFK
jgi:outer membrane protein OmpA-like peptidoglycan-associated protein